MDSTVNGYENSYNIAVLGIDWDSPYCTAKTAEEAHVVFRLAPGSTEGEISLWDGTAVPVSAPTHETLREGVRMLSEGLNRACYINHHIDDLRTILLTPKTGRLQVCEATVPGNIKMALFAAAKLALESLRADAAEGIVLSVSVADDEIDLDDFEDLVERIAEQFKPTRQTELDVRMMWSLLLDENMPEGAARVTMITLQ